MDLDLVVDTGAEQVPVIVTAQPAATVADLRRALADLALATAGPAAAPVLLDGRTRLADDAALSACGLRPGAVLALPGRGTRPAPGSGTGSTGGAVEVAVVGGLHGGLSVALPPAGTVTVGRGEGTALRLPDPEVSRAHLTVLGQPDGRAVTVVDPGSTNGIRLGRWRLTGPARLDLDEAGQVVGIGGSMLAVRRPGRLPAESTPGRAGLRLINRPPRIATPDALPELVVPMPPKPPTGFRFPWLATLAPAVVCGALYLVLPAGGYAIYLLLMMVMSPILALANLVQDRRHGRRDHQRAKATYETAKAAFGAALAAAAADEEAAARLAHPDPTELVARTLVPAATLWQRRRADGDYLQLRLGLHDRPARLLLRPDQPTSDEPLPEPPVVRDVPVGVDLGEAGVLGVAGPRPMTLAVARALLLQAAALRSPADLGIVLLTGRDTAGDWDWATWLPHTLPTAAADCARLVATDAAQADARLAELRRLIGERVEERRLALRNGPPPGRTMLVVLDGARRLRDLPGLAGLLADGPAAGVHAICLDADETALPDECGATLVATDGPGSRATLRRRGYPPEPDVLVDGLTLPAAATAARALAPLRPLGELSADTALPERVRLLDLPGAAETDAAAVRAGWERSPDGRSTTAVLGVGTTGPVTVDLRRDGPHALIAGTSGAGKSELLQTLVASLALGNAPDALTFVLVDYKGGSAFAACADLPHCVGLVTDLDGHLAKRALDSLAAELRRREILFAGADATDIEDYWARTAARLPRLVIIIDEFASLVEELPEFVPGVVGIGMRGRSLGVHVVLATQRPGGVVTADLRANVNLRISLRVTSVTDSQDVIDAPDAARIPHRRPGRAFLRTGHGELTEFQAARVGGPRPGTDACGPPVRIALRRVDDLGRPRPAAAVADPAGPTDLTDLVAAIRAAAEGRPAPARPWQEPLPDVVPLSALPVPPHANGTAAAVLGLADRPDEQAQDPFVLDLERTGCVAVAGTVRAGRSTALRTLAAALAADASPADLHLYALDCGNQALAPLSALPHCGAVVAGDDTARTERLLTLLQDEVGRRQRRLAVAGHASLAEHRAAHLPEADPLPYLVLLIDRLEGFLARYAELDGGRAVDRLESLLRTGPAVGVTVVLSTDRTGFPHRISSAVAARLVLRQATTDDAAAFGVDPRILPRHLPAGRAVWADSGEQVQIALLDPDPAGAAQTAAVERLGATLTARWDGTAAGRLPRRLDPLPDELTAADAEALRRHDRPTGPAVCTPAVGGDQLGPLDLDLADLGGAFVVAGPQRSGRSTALLAIARSLAGRGDGRLPVLVVATRPSPLRDLAGEPGTLGVLTGAAAEIAAEIADAAESGPFALVVDDGELLADFELTELLEAFARGARDSGSLLVAAATTEDLQASPYRGWLATARRGRSGLLLDPASHVDGEVFGLRLPRSVNGGWPPGRGLLVRRGAAEPVQVVLPERIPAAGSRGR